MIRSLFLLFWTVLLVAAPSFFRGASAADDTPLRVLFVGNSLTFYNDMPIVIQRLAASADRPLEVEAITDSGMTLGEHWRRGQVQAALQQGGWDFVVLQEFSTRPLDNTEAFYRYVRLFDAEIKAVGARTVLFQNWTLEGFPEDIERLNAVYAEIADEVEAVVAPLGQAWDNARREDPEVGLYVDERHPSFEGTYLGASVLFATLCEQSPVGLTSLSLSQEDAEFLQGVAWETAGDAGGLIGVTGEYFQDLDLTSLALARADATIDFDWDFGAPDPLLDADTFSVRWTGQLRPRHSEEYTFITTSDDGVRLWVDGQLLIDHWTDHGITEDQGTITLEAGQRYDIQMEFYENGGYATAKLEWQSARQEREIVPESRF